ncbi:hypothetical protein HPB50_002873 [Hyalomma asiaticum]|uniref:Uncharacterized protein n=1 Tax=Hyalomma asiaticum TaxID=266040 RepID=A0ACB7SDI9_HYAAI|nr:hypothetical protein HPB50_002873 [Hyalomma asiaticum]
MERDATDATAEEQLHSLGPCGIDERLNHVSCNLLHKSTKPSAPRLSWASALHLRNVAQLSRTVRTRTSWGVLPHLLPPEHAKRPADEAVSTPRSSSDEPDAVGAARVAAADEAGGEPPPWLSPADRPLNGGMGAIGPPPPPPRVSRARPGAPLHAPRPRARQPRGPAGEEDHDSATRTATIDTTQHSSDEGPRVRRKQVSLRRYTHYGERRTLYLTRARFGRINRHKRHNVVQYRYKSTNTVLVLIQVSNGETLLSTLRPEHRRTTDTTSRGILVLLESPVPHFRDTRNIRSDDGHYFHRNEIPQTHTHVSRVPRKGRHLRRRDPLSVQSVDRSRGSAGRTVRSRCTGHSLLPGYATTSTTASGD